MPRRSQKKRAQRRQVQLENDINTNGIDDHRPGTFKVYDQRARKTIASGKIRVCVCGNVFFKAFENVFGDSP